MRKRIGDPAETTKAEAPAAVEDNNIVQECEALKGIVARAYQEPILMDEAERLAARFLNAQMLIAEELRTSDLDARMRKNGLKAVKASVYMAAATAGEKKPSEGFLENLVTKDSVVQREQDAYDRADSYKESLTIYLGIFKDAHIYFRGIAKGRYDG